MNLSLYQAPRHPAAYPPRRQPLHTGRGAGSVLFGDEGTGFRALLLACIDPRMIDPVHSYMRQRGLQGKYSQFTLAGAAAGIIAPVFADWRGTFWENLAASIQLHHVPKVIVINHRDCGAVKIAYGEKATRDPRKETATHRAIFAEFRREMAIRHPNLRLETWLMSLDGEIETIS